VPSLLSFPRFLCWFTSLPPPAGYFNNRDHLLYNPGMWIRDRSESGFQSKGNTWVRNACVNSSRVRGIHRRDSNNYLQHSASYSSNKVTAYHSHDDRGECTQSMTVECDAEFGALAERRAEEALRGVRQQGRRWRASHQKESPVQTLDCSCWMRRSAVCLAGCAEQTVEG